MENRHGGLSRNGSAHGKLYLGNTMPSFSIVIPLIDSVPAFEFALAAALRYRPEDAQVVCPLAQQYRDPFGLIAAKEIEAISIPGQHAGGVWKAAMDACRHDIVVWLGQGLQIDESTFPSLEQAFSDPTVGCALPRIEVEISGSKQCRIDGLRVDSTGTRRWVTSSGPTFNARSSFAMGPTWIAGAYRQQALAWLNLDDLMWDERYWDAELFLALQALGFQSYQSGQWVVRMSGLAATAIVDRAHGSQASRGCRRYRNAEAGRPWSAIAADLLAGLRSPWRFVHCVQRLFALPQAARDRHFAGQLCERRSEIERLLRSQPSGSTSRAADGPCNNFGNARAA